MAKKIGRKILDLLGRKFQVGDWEFIPIPLLGIPKGYLPCYTRDRLSGIQISLFFSSDKTHYIMQTFNPELRLYVRYSVKFLGYDPSQDMRNIKV